MYLVGHDTAHFLWLVTYGSKNIIFKKFLHHKKTKSTDLQSLFIEISSQEIKFKNYTQWIYMINWMVISKTRKLSKIVSNTLPLRVKVF